MSAKQRAAQAESAKTAWAARCSALVLADILSLEGVSSAASDHVAEGILTYVYKSVM